MSASEWAESPAIALGDVVIRVIDRGPEPAWHDDGSLFGPWRRFEAELPSYPIVREQGSTPWEAVSRSMSMHRGLLERRWST